MQFFKFWGGAQHTKLTTETTTLEEMDPTSPGYLKIKIDNFKPNRLLASCLIVSINEQVLPVGSVRPVKNPEDAFRELAWAVPANHDEMNLVAYSRLAP